MRDSHKSLPIAALMQVVRKEIHQIALQHKAEPAACPILPAVLTQLQALRGYLGRGLSEHHNETKRSVNGHHQQASPCA